MEEFNYDNLVKWAKVRVINSLLSSISMGFVGASLTKLQGEYLTGAMISIVSIIFSLVGIIGALWSRSLRANEKMIDLYVKMKFYIDPLLELSMLPVIGLLIFNLESVLLVMVMFALYRLIKPLYRISWQQIHKFILNKDDHDMLNNMKDFNGFSIDLIVSAISFIIFMYFGKIGVVINIWLFLGLKILDFSVTIYELSLFRKIGLTSEVMNDYISKHDKINK